jgi:hypothetical protein
MIRAPRFAYPFASGQRLQGFVPLCKAGGGLILDIAQGQNEVSAGPFSGEHFGPFVRRKIQFNQKDAIVISRSG